MIGKLSFVFIFICAITQAKCQNNGSPGDSGVPQSFVGGFFRRTADIRREFADMVDKIIASLKGAWKTNTGGLFSGFKKILGRDNNIIVDPEINRELYDMNMRPPVELFNRRPFQDRTYDVDVKPAVEVFNGRLFPEQNNEVDVKPAVEVFNSRLFQDQNYDGDVKPAVEVFSRRLFPEQNYNGRYMRTDFVAKIISDLCAEGAIILGVCNG